jgi:RNA polymerase sigma-70 factor (ECF subfamily)
LNVDEPSDQARFTLVFVPYLVDAFRFARWLTGSRADAEDIVQEASMRAFKNIRGFSGGNPRAWVLTIVRNTSYSWLAKNRPTGVVLSDDLDQDHREQIEQTATQEMQTPETALIAKLEADQVRKAMAVLPAPFREILVLREVHDLDYRTIAEVAALPIGTVMSRLARARRLLTATIATGIP